MKNRLVSIRIKHFTEVCLELTISPFYLRHTVRRSSRMVSMTSTKGQRLDIFKFLKEMLGLENIDMKALDDTNKDSYIIITRI